jgi:hypothetical protein
LQQTIYGADMGKVVGGHLAEAFFDAWRQRIQSEHTFPLPPAVRNTLKKEYQDWYYTNLGIVRTDSAASSALANCDPSLPAKKKVGARFAAAAACPL